MVDDDDCLKTLAICLLLISSFNVHCLVIFWNVESKLSVASCKMPLMRNATLCPLLPPQRIILQEVTISDCRVKLSSLNGRSATNADKILIEIGNDMLTP